MSNFEGLFNTPQVEQEEEDGPAVPKFSTRWKWFSMIERLAGGDITKFNDVYDVEYISALNTLSYWKERDDYENMMRKRQEMMSKHR